MKVVCPSCGADYRVNEEKVPAEGQSITCPSCQATFLVFSDGTTSSDAIDSGGRSTPPPLPPTPLDDASVPPPPPDGLDDLLAPPEIDDLSDDLELTDDPTFVGAGAVPQPPSSPVDDHAPPSPLDLDDVGAASQPVADVDDFDFSFGATDSVARPYLQALEKLFCKTKSK